MELPKFKYSPNAYQINVFEEQEGTCSVCSQPREIKYATSFYSVEEPEYICPWCIADGSAAKKFEGEFTDAAGVERPAGYGTDDEIKRSFDEKALEVTERTPGYICWQGDRWLTHCNEPCAFIGYADTETIKPILHELEADIEKSGLERKYIVEYLSKDGSPGGYLFRCLHCGTHRLHVDID
jgi:uncharacterized protein CbrC (UPF0167 family)